MNLNEIQRVFFQECAERLATMEASFAILRHGDYDSETINIIFRSVHSIKGGAGAFGHQRLQAFTHEYETLLDLVRNGTIQLTSNLLATIMDASDMLTDHVAAARNGGDPPVHGQLFERLAAFSAQQSSTFDDPLPDGAPPAEAAGDGLMMYLLCEQQPVAADVSDWEVVFIPGADVLKNGSDPMLLLRELILLGGEVLTAGLSRLPRLAELHAERPYFGWGATVPGAVSEADDRSIFEFIDDSHLSVARIVPAVAQTDTIEELLDGSTDAVSAPPALAPISVKVVRLASAASPEPVDRCGKGNSIVG